MQGITINVVTSTRDWNSCFYARFLLNEIIRLQGLAIKAVTVSRPHLNIYRPILRSFARNSICQYFFSLTSRMRTTRSLACVALPTAGSGWTRPASLVLTSNWKLTRKPMWLHRCKCVYCTSVLMLTADMQASHMFVRHVPSVCCRLVTMLFNPEFIWN